MNNFQFDRVPALEELLPKTGGRAGVTYALVSTTNLRRAQDEGWERLAGNTHVYTVQGPKGTVDFELWGRGKPIVGQEPNSSRCQCVVDVSLYENTGLQRPGEPIQEPPPEKSAAAKTTTKD